MKAPTFSLSRWASDERFWDALALLLIFATGYVANAWVLSANNYFGMDDFGWMDNLRRSKAEGIFTLLPVYPCNDRPVGMIFMKAVYAWFSLDQQRIHLIQLLIHLANAWLAYLLAGKLAQLFQGATASAGQNRLFALVAALFFVGWPVATSVPTAWTSAAFDLLACTFTLGTLRLYFEDPKSPFAVFDTVLAGILYLLAIRTKEMAVVVPVVCVMLELLIQYPANGWRIRSYRLRWFRLLVLWAIQFLFHDPSLHVAFYQKNKAEDLALLQSKGPVLDFNQGKPILLPKP